MSEPIRVAMIMGKMVGGGVEAVVMNYYKHIDRSKIQFDFIIDSDSTAIPQKEILELGGKIFIVPPYQNVLNYMKKLRSIFKENNYFIVHSHINTLSVIPLSVAKRCSIPVRIAHNHSTAGNDEFKKNFLKYFLRLFSKKFPTHYMAPIYETGKWIFGDKIAKTELYILPNAFDIDKFRFDIKQRKEVRKKLRINEADFVLGNIGRMVYSKNQTFIIKILDELYKKNKNIKLILVGDGPLKNELINEIRKKGLINNVIMVSNVTDIEKYYMAIDLFLFPSYYEGLGLAAVEAQATGLPVIVNEKLPSEIRITNHFYEKNISKKSEWLDEIEVIMNTNIERSDYQKLKLQKFGYDINIESKKLVEFYYSQFRRINGENNGRFN